MRRGGGSPCDEGRSAATSTEEIAAWDASSAPPPRRTAALIARSTARPICSGPVPMTSISASPMTTPSDTPSTISIARWVR